jgi:NAD(P)-dependent dehydrogenase (short-subunit alcohol dehydrogenase family)
MSSVSFTGKSVVVTGGSGALGRSVTKEFAKSEAMVAVPYIIDQEVGLTKEALGPQLMSRVALSKVDMFNWSQVENFFSSVAKKNFGRIDILVNLVGGYFGGPTIHETEENDWDRMMNLNLKSHFLSCKAALPYMVKQRYGRIVSVSSESALRGEATLGVYSASKSGVVRLTETISEEYRMSGITANCILPRIIDTPANREAMPDADFSKWPKPEEIAKVVLFLASDSARVVTGASVTVIGTA